MQQPVNNVLEHFFRHEYGKLVSILTIKFGNSKIDTVEDAVQEALLKAMQIWSFQEIPTAPEKWLYRVAHNRIIDVLRRDAKTTLLETEILKQEENVAYEYYNGVEDEQLKMIFACCHPALSEGDQLMLSLKLLCGFSNKEIARALFKKTEAVKKGVFRAKQKFKTEIGELEIPREEQLKGRLSAVLKVIYLLFNNGYIAFEGDQLLKKDVCEDALRLAGLLYVNKVCNTPELCALISLMCSKFSRFDARISEKGELMTLEFQNRSKWNKELIQMGARYLGESMDGANYSNYHLEAVIASAYVTAESFEKTNWQQILSIYDILILRSNNETLALNRLVVFAKVKGDQSALEELEKLNFELLKENHYYYSIKAEFQKNLNLPAFKESVKKAISLTNNQIEKDFLRKKIS